MTGPSHPPLDEQERELARILRALPGAEPSAALDQRILRAAADAAAATPQRSLRRSVAFGGAAWGIGGAAAAVLALGVGWHLFNPAREPAIDATAPIPVEAPAEDAVTVGLAEPRAQAPRAEPAPAPATATATATATAKPRAPVPRRSAVAAPVVAADGPAEAPAGVIAPAPASPPPPPPAVAPAPQASVLDAATADRAQAQAAAEMAGASASAEAERAQAQAAEARDATLANAKATAPPARRTGAMTPALWLAQVRRLRDEQRIGDAAESLRRFHQYYPQYVIPADLLPLMRE